MEVSDDVGEITARDVEFADCQAEYNMLLELIQEELKVEENLTQESDVIKKELDESSFIEDIKTHAMLEKWVFD